MVVRQAGQPGEHDVLRQLGCREDGDSVLRTAPAISESRGGAGLTAAECRALVLEVRQEADVTRLDDPALWGRDIDDERYLLVSRS